MITCKKCRQAATVKNGLVRGKQRYRCKACGCNFVEGDARVDPHAAAKRAWAVLLYAVGKGSLRFIARLLKVSPAAVWTWVRREAADLTYPSIAPTIREMEFDEMWHFLRSKKAHAGSSRRWIVLSVARLPGWSAIVMRPPLPASTTGSSTGKTARFTQMTGMPSPGYCR